MCGTNPAFLVMKSWIERRKVRGEAAAQLIAAMPSYLLSPSSVLVRYFYSMVRTTANFEEQQVKISSILAFSHILRVACTNSASRKARYSHISPKCNWKVTNEYLPYMINQMKQNTSLQRVYMNAIGNTASPAAMKALLNVAKDSNISPYTRASAVFATKYIVFKYPKTSMYELLDLFHNPMHPTAVKIAALSLLIYTRPALVVWQRIAISTWYEPNEAVRAFIWSTFNNLAHLQDPVYHDM